MLESIPVEMLPLLVFGGIALAMLLVGLLFIRSGRSRDALADGGPPRPRPLFGPLTSGLAGVLPISRSARGKIEKQLKRAGFYSRLALDQFLATRNALVVGWCLLVGVAIVAIADPHTDETLKLLIGGGILAIVLYAVPRLWLESLADRRVRRIQAGLPDALDMITMCLTGGLPLLKAFQRVGEDLRPSHGDLAMELEIIRRQADAYTMEQALAQFAERIDVPEIRSLTALVTQTERLGTNVALALRDFADGIRRSHRQRAEEKGNTTSVKLLLPVAFCLAPPVYILLLAPPLLEMKNFVSRENRPGGILVPSEGNSPATDLPARRSLSVPLPERTAPPLSIVPSRDMPGRISRPGSGS